MLHPPPIMQYGGAPPAQQGTYGPIGGSSRGAASSNLNTTPARGYGGTVPVAHIYGHGYNRFTNPHGYPGAQQPAAPPQQFGPGRSGPYSQPPPPQESQRRGSGFFGRMRDVGRELWNGLRGDDVQRRRGPQHSPPRGRQMLGSQQTGPPQHEQLVGMQQQGFGGGGMLVHPNAGRSWQELPMTGAAPSTMLVPPPIGGVPPRNQMAPPAMSRGPPPRFSGPGVGPPDQDPLAITDLYLDPRGAPRQQYGAPGAPGWRTGGGGRSFGGRGPSFGSSFGRDAGRRRFILRGSGGCFDGEWESFRGRGAGVFWLAVCEFSDFCFRSRSWENQSRFPAYGLWLRVLS